MKLYLTIATLLLLSALATAQSNYKSGFAVTLKGDTLYGTIDPHGLHGSPKKVKFNTTAGSAMILTPNNTRYLEVKGREAYQRYAGFITLDQIGEMQVRNGRDTSMRFDTVFLKLLARGEKLSLYSFSDDIKTRFYITEKDGEMPIELGYRVYYNNAKVDVVQGIGRTVNENTYMTQLYNITLKHGLMTPDMLRQIEWLRYSKGYILEVVNKINGVKK